MRAHWAVVAAVAWSAAPVRAADVTPGQSPPSLGTFEVVQGNPFADLKGLRGRVVKLVFFATW